MSKKRILAVDYIKCIACLLILNSHLAPLYPGAFKRLAFGGFFGNCLFFFCTGFLLMKARDTFSKWYGKKIVRVILPYFLLLPLLFFDGRLKELDVLNIFIPFKLYHFIPTILILYITYYIALFLSDKAKIRFLYMILALTIVCFLYFYLAYDYENSNIYDHFTFLEMCTYFIMMLLGGYMKSKEHPFKRCGIYLAAAVICFGIYLYQSVFGFPKFLSIFQLVAAVGFSYCISGFFLCCEEKLKQNKLVDFISKVTLEAYLAHWFCIDAYEALGFPTNIVLFFLSVFGIAYCLHIVSDKLSGKILSLPVFSK